MTLASATTLAAVVLAQAAPDAVDIARTLRSIEFDKIVTALLIIAVGYSINRLVESGLDRLGERLPRRRLLLKKVSSFARLAVFVLGTYLAIATVLEDEQSAAIGVMGTLALAVGFALKDTASSVMAGLLILVDQPFQVGDRIRFGQTYGEVKEIGLRTVRVATLDQRVVSIPNNRFLTEQVASANDGDLDMMVEVSFFVAVDEDADLVKKLVYEACVTSRYVYLNKPVVMRVRDEEVSYAFVTRVTCKAYVVDARFEKAYVTDVTERVKTAFHRHRIQSPYAKLYEVSDADIDTLPAAHPADG